jgi:CRP/FNR family transcriptional regulator, cyclic AMP receptor protein
VLPPATFLPSGWLTGGKALRPTVSSAPEFGTPQCYSRGTERHDVSQNMDIYEALIASGIFSRTNPATVAVLSKQLKAEHFPSGCVVNAQRDFNGRLYLIISGKAKIVYRHLAGAEIVLTILGPTQIFGAKTLFDPDSSGFSITMLTEVVAVPIERDLLLGWIAEHPEIGEQLLRLFARWAEHTMNSVFDLAFAGAESRVARHLLLLSQRFGCRDGDVVRVEHDLTQKDFYVLVGVTSEAVRATLRDFEARGWIRMEENSVLIVDAQALRSVQKMNGQLATRADLDETVTLSRSRAGEQFLRSLTSASPPR